MARLRVAIGGQLRRCPRVITLGIRQQLSDYSLQERGLLRAADIIFYPTRRFVDVFATIGKETFPSPGCYRFLGDKLKQTALLHLLKVPHPRTRVYYGAKQKNRILDDFGFPLVAKRPFRSSGGRHVFLIRDRQALDWYTRRFNPAYIQEYVFAERELRVVVLNYRAVLGYWRQPASGDFRANLAQGATLVLDRVPAEAALVAKGIASAASLSDVAVDLLFDGSRFWVVELNFRYGTRGWLQAGMDRIEMIKEMIERGEL